MMMSTSPAYTCLRRIAAIFVRGNKVNCVKTASRQREKAIKPVLGREEAVFVGCAVVGCGRADRQIMLVCSCQN